jgi:hypothetical protein
MKHKPDKTKVLSQRVQGGKIGSMKRRSVETDVVPADLAAKNVQLAKESAAMWSRRAKDLQEHPERFEPGSYAGGNLKRGPKPDTSRSAGDKCTKVMSMVVTPNEYAVLEKFRKSFPFPPSQSQFARWLVTTFMMRSGGAAFYPPAGDRLENDPEVQQLRGVVESRGS